MTSTQEPLTRTALVIPVFNRRETTLQALRSLRKVRTDGLDVRIFVIDDGSTDGTAEAIKNDFPDVRLEFGDGTLHYAAGTNRGIEAAMKWGADLVVAMNDDSIFHEDFLVKLVETSKRFERSIVGASLLLWDNPHLTFQIAPTWSSVNGGWIFPQNKPIFSFPSEPYQVECIVGNCVLFPAAAIEENGLMDETNFPTGWGDVQYTMRMKKAGWNLIVDPSSKVWCEPNTYPAPLHTLPFSERVRILCRDRRHPANLGRQFKALWHSAPSRTSAVIAFAFYVGSLGLKAANIIPLATRTKQIRSNSAT